VKRGTLKVADAELAVLRLLWARQPLSAREITEQLYRAATNSDIGTVQNLLKRLEAKQLVRRDRSQHRHTFAATVSRTEFAGKQLEQMAEKLTDGSLAPFLIHLVKGPRLSREERDEIRKLLDKRA
jgi:predicted transcriptional regulator